MDHAHTDGARRALAAFLAATDGATSWQRADRALTLHMLEGHAPAFFAAAASPSLIDAATSALASVPTGFPIGLPPAEAMARLDAIYVARERDVAATLDDEALTGYLRSILGTAPIHAWLLGEIAAQIGGTQPLRLPPRPLRAVRRADLYWLTHLFLLDTRYLRRPLDRARRAGEIDEIVGAVPEIVAAGEVDLGAELAFCLQAAGETARPEHEALLGLIAAHQLPGGQVVDPATAAARLRDPADAPRIEAHATAAALIALAGAA